MSRVNASAAGPKLSEEPAWFGGPTVTQSTPGSPVLPHSRTRSNTLPPDFLFQFEGVSIPLRIVSKADPIASVKIDLKEGRDTRAFAQAPLSGENLPSKTGVVKAFGSIPAYPPMLDFLPSPSPSVTRISSSTILSPASASKSKLDIHKLFQSPTLSPVSSISPQSSSNLALPQPSPLLFSETSPFVQQPNFGYHPYGGNADEHAYLRGSLPSPAYWQLPNDDRRTSLMPMNDTDLETRKQELLRREDGVKLRELELRRMEEEVKAKHEEARQREEAAERMEEQVMLKEQEANVKLRELQYKDEELNAREQTTKRREAELDRLISTVRERAIMLKLQSVFVDTNAYRRLLKCSGTDAQRILDTFQYLLDTDSFPERRQLVVAMRRLSAKTHLYPQRYVLDGPFELIYNHPVDSGKYADIYKANFQGQPTCLKVIRAHTTSLVQHMAKVYAREAILWGQLSHPNLLPFYGLHIFRSQIAFVAPWAENGNLNDYLAREPKANRALLCADAAAGVEYLHENEIVHGDLKALNVLVDGSGRACLSDFGLSGVADKEIIKWATQSSAASKGGTSRWQAPELHNPEVLNIHNTKESDVFAWASTCYEVFTGNPPFYEINRETTVALMILRGDLPSRPRASDRCWTELGLTKGLWKLFEDCWAMDASERPNISAVRSRLAPEQPAEDERPSAQWELGFAMRFRNAQVSDTQNGLLESLDNILSKVTGGTDLNSHEGSTNGVSFDEVESTQQSEWSGMVTIDEDLYSKMFMPFPHR